MQRRHVLTLSGFAAAGATAISGIPLAEKLINSESPYSPQTAISGLAKRIEDAYAAVVNESDATWFSYVTVLEEDGWTDSIADKPNELIEAASVNKVGIAIAVCHKIDQGQLALDDLVALEEDDILDGSGIYYLQGTYGDQLTVANILVALLGPSDNTAVRLCGKLCPPEDINDIFDTMGFSDTRVEPDAEHEDRMTLGDTSPRDTNGMITQLIQGDLLEEETTNFLFGIMRWENGYHDGIRRNMSSEERRRIGSKYGAFEPRRHEVGFVSNEDGQPVVVYSFFAELEGEEEDNYGATHPIVESHAHLGRSIMDAVEAKS